MKKLSAQDVHVEVLGKQLQTPLGARLPSFEAAKGLERAVRAHRGVGLREAKAWRLPWCKWVGRTTSLSALLLHDSVKEQELQQEASGCEHRGLGWQAKSAEDRLAEALHEIQELKSALEKEGDLAKAAPTLDIPRFGEGGGCPGGQEDRREVAGGGG